MQHQAEATNLATGMPEVDVKALVSLRHGLATSVINEVSSEMAKSICDFGVQYLDKLIAKHTEWPSILRRQNVRQAAVLRRIAALLQDSKVIDAELHATADAAAQSAESQSDASLQALEQAQCALDAVLEKLAPLLLSDARLRSGKALAEVNALLREQIATIHDSEAEFTLTQKRNVERHLTLVNSMVSVSREKLQAYLHQRFPERKNLEITSYNELTGGSSKSTILMDVRGFDHDGVTPLVVRLDRSAGSTNTRVVDEVPTLQAMQKLDLPVPEVLWEEPDASKIGLAFIVVRKVENATVGGGLWHADPRVCNVDTAIDLARLLAKLHTLDAVSMGMHGALNSDPHIHPMRGLINNSRGMFKTYKMVPDGTMESCLCWLEQNMPPAPRKLSLVHGDVGLHNILIRDHKIAAILDWELSHLGDPIEDLSYVKMTVEQLMPWEEFLAAYRKHGGGEYSEEIGRYYGIWRGVRNGIHALKMKHCFSNDTNPDMIFGFYATYYRMVLLEAADQLALAGTR